MNPSEMKRVTVGIPTYNEEENIGRLLWAVINQHQDERIAICQVVVSDDSVDRTPDIVTSVSRRFDKRNIVELYHHHKRRGYTSALNELFERAKGDVLLILDGDILINRSDLVITIVSPFLKIKNLGIVGGSPIALNPRSLAERAGVQCNRIWRFIRREYKGGSNLYAVNGRVMALSSTFYKKLRIPEQIIGGDAYTYLKCIQLGHKVHYVDDAVVYYREPNTFHEFILRRVRVEKSYLQLQEILGSWIVKEKKIPSLLEIRGALATVLTDLLGLILACILILIVKLMTRRAVVGAKYEIATSTKRLF